MDDYRMAFMRRLSVTQFSNVNAKGANKRNFRIGLASWNNCRTRLIDRDKRGSEQEIRKTGRFARYTVTARCPGTMDEIAREICEMNLDDPVRAERLQKLCALSQLTRSLKPKGDKMIHERMDALAREILTLPRGHQRRVLIVGEILWLIELISK